MYSYHGYEVITEQLVADRLVPADSRLSSRARGEFDQMTVTRHFRNNRAQESEGRAKRRRELVANLAAALANLVRVRAG